MDKARTLTARLLEKLAASITDIGESYTGVCDSGMIASQITIVCDDLKDFDDDYFNDGWLMYIAHNDDAPGTVPEGETRDIINYVGATGTFTTAAFSANVEEDDVVIVARVTTFIIDQVKLIVSPIDGSLASFISSGNGSTSYGSRIGTDKSIVDAIGHNGVTTLGSGIYGNIGNFAGQTHLQTLLASLGIPDITAKPLYTCLIPDRLDHGTFGLSGLRDSQMLYDTVLYVDANSVYGDDANTGTKDEPFLTITASVAAASEYTTIVCSDSRVGALAVGFDEDAAVTGVTVDKNHITIVGGHNGGHKAHVGNTITDANNVFNVTGKHVAIAGLAVYLEDKNGDEVTVLVPGDGFRMECCDIPAEIPGEDQNECIRITGNHFVLSQVHTVGSDIGLRCTGGVEIGRLRNCTFQAAAADGVLLEDGTVDVYAESCQFQACGDAIDIDAGATHNAFYECNFANNTNIWVNGGGATNQLINAKEESKITAGNTSEDDLKAINDKTSLMNSATGFSTLNDANTSDTIIPGSLPTNMHVIFDISNLNNNGDDFDIEVKVGVAASERVVAYYNLTSDGTDITADKGSGTGSIVKQRRIDISDILVYTGEQIIVELTKNGAADRNVLYKYLCGV